MRSVPDVYADVREFLRLPGSFLLHDVQSLPLVAGSSSDGGGRLVR